MFSCSNEKKDFVVAKELNTIEAFETFINNSGKSVYADSAKIMINQIQKVEFDNVKFVNKLEEYEKFLIKYPNGVFVDSVKTIIYKEKYNLVIKKGNIGLIEEYVSNYPESPFIDECNKKIKQLKYQTSDSGIKSNVLSLIKGSCTRKRAKITVNNGNVKVSMNCIEVSRECLSKGNSFSAVLSGRRKCRSQINSLYTKIKRLPGVKSAEVNDTSE